MKAADFLRQRGRIDYHQERRSPAWHRRALASLVREAEGVPVVECRRVIGWRMTDGSIACIKRRFQTVETAQDAVDAIALMEGTHPKPARPYRCPYCKGWHVAPATTRNNAEMANKCIPPRE